MGVFWGNRETRAARRTALGSAPARRGRARPARLIEGSLRQNGRLAPGRTGARLLPPPAAFRGEPSDETQGSSMNRCPGRSQRSGPKLEMIVAVAGGRGDVYRERRSRGQRHADASARSGDGGARRHPNRRTTFGGPGHGEGRDSAHLATRSETSTHPRSDRARSGPRLRTPPPPRALQEQRGRGRTRRQQEAAIASPARGIDLRMSEYGDETLPASRMTHAKAVVVRLQTAGGGRGPRRARRPLDRACPRSRAGVENGTTDLPGSRRSRLGTPARAGSSDQAAAITATWRIA